jgi:Holliday junction resolvase
MGAPRYRQRPDKNQRQIVDALEKIGCTVYDASRVGGGFPDLVVGRAGQCYLLECKTQKGKLNAEQQRFRDWWNGNYAVVRTPMEAVKAVTNG